MSVSRSTILLACSLLFTASVTAAQRPAVGDSKVGVRVALRVDGAAYEFNGQAACVYIPGANVVGVSGQNWQVMHDEAGRRLVLSFLRPTSGNGDMFSLHVSSGDKQYVTNTIVLRRGVVKGPTEGSGKVTLESAGVAGTFTIDAVATNGAKLTGTVMCDAFKPRTGAAGGN